jgi:hypothetical protein
VSPLHLLPHAVRHRQDPARADEKVSFICILHFSFNYTILVCACQFPKNGKNENNRYKKEPNCKKPIDKSKKTGYNM